MFKLFAVMLVAMMMSGSAAAFAGEASSESNDTSDWIKQTIAAAMNDGASTTPAKQLHSGSTKVRIAQK